MVLRTGAEFVSREYLMPNDAEEKSRGLPVFLAPDSPRQLFVHDTAVMRDLNYPSQISDAQHFFAERALWLAQPDDLVVLANPIELAYLEYVREQNLGPDRPPSVPCFRPGTVASCCLTDRILANPDWLATIEDWVRAAPSDIALSTFCTTPETVRLSKLVADRFGQAVPATDNAQAMGRANEKVFVRQGLTSTGMAQIPGMVVETWGNDARRTADLLWNQVSGILTGTPRAMIRANRSSAGTGNFIAAPGDRARMEEWLSGRAQTDAYLVEAFVPARSSPNIQYWIDSEGSAHFVAATDQRLDGATIYDGSRYPSATESMQDIQALSGQVLDWLAAQGVRGMVGIDYLETEDPHGHRGLKFVEVNARYNGSSYATAIWSQINRMRSLRGQLPLTHWQMYRLVRTSLRTFSELRDRTHDLLYRPGACAGVVPYWTGALAHGIFGCVSMGRSLEEIEGLEAEFLSRVDDHHDKSMH